MWDDGDYYSDRGLWRAVTRGDPAAVDKVLGEGGDINLKALHENMTLVYVAIRNKDYAIAEALLKAGADVNAPSGYLEFNPFILACDKGDGQAISLLLKYKADVNARTHDQETGLHRAAWRGDNALIKRLVDDLGCDVNAQNYLGQTALFCAVSSNLPETIKTLMELGADPGIEGSVGFGLTTPRAFAGGMEQRQEVAATLDDPALQEAGKNKIYQPVTSKPVNVGKPLSFKMKPRGASFARL